MCVKLHAKKKSGKKLTKKPDTHTTKTNALN